MQLNACLSVRSTDDTEPASSRAIGTTCDRLRVTSSSPLTWPWPPVWSARSHTRSSVRGRLSRTAERSLGMSMGSRCAVAGSVVAPLNFPTLPRARPVHLVLVAVLAGCQAGSGGATAPVGDPVAIPPGQYSGLAWLPSNWLVVSAPPEPEDVGSPFVSYRFRPDGQDLEEVAFPHVDCRRVEYLAPTTLPDGRLGVLQLCYGEEVIPHAEVVALDIETGEAETLVDLAGLGTVHTGQMTWNPDLDRGFLAHGSGLCQGIVGLTRNGVEYLTVEIAEGDRSFRLDEMFQDDIEREETGQANYPAWSPDGEQIAFFASTEAIGVAGYARADVPYGLYVMEPDGQHVSRLVAEVFSSRYVAWSPDGETLAFAGVIDGTRALWLLDRDGETPSALAEVYALWLAWSPDGDRIAVSIPTGPESSSDRIEVRLIPVGEPGS